LVNPLIARSVGPLHGDIRVPGDKSISHRALMLGAVAVGETQIEGLLEAADVGSTKQALRALGVSIKDPDGGASGERSYRVQGLGVGGLHESDHVLDFGNSGTGARLLAGLLAAHPFTSFLTGDHSLRSRPMARITEPLSRMGARFVARSGCRLPLAIVGARDPVPLRHRLGVSSAQVKSAILLAGLNTPGRTCVIEPLPTRDHSERMLRGFGVEVTTELLEDGARAIEITGQPEMLGRLIRVPGDPSSAAFPVVAALINPGSEITIRALGTNPLRLGLFETLHEMGAEIEFSNQHEESGEPVADLTVRANGLRGVDVPASRSPSMIDEYPALAIAAACAEGTTRLYGLSELRVKESDRLLAIAQGLHACGVKVERGENHLMVHGVGGPPPGGATIDSQFDHRIAMAFLTLGTATCEPVAIADSAAIDTSFPGFVRLMNGLGCSLAAPEAA
jgi:3-phosphoshikimate 1-carboxyvinyltransferase